MKIHQILSQRYELREKLGSGGVSTVYRAWDMVRREELAVKVIHPHLVEDELIVQRFKQEIAITRKISHPGIVRYYEMLESDEGAYLTLEYLSGGDVKMHLRERGPMSVAETLRMGGEMLQALQAAHELGVIHCDIKPHNILLDSEGHIRITDFGFARSSLSLDMTERGNVGTPDYAAPEIALGEFPDARSDLYSCGVTLFEMLSGRLPFQSNSPHQTLWKHANAPVPSVRAYSPSVPGALDQIIKKSMAKNVSDRYQTAAEFADALANMEAPTPAVSAATHPCARCGALVLDSLPYCFSCGGTEVTLLSPPQGDPAFHVVVQGPGKPGDRLDPQLRHGIISLLKTAGAEAPNIEKRIPRLPFTLFTRLSLESAAEVKTELEGIGINAAILGKTSKGSKKRAFALFNKKLLALYPRYLLIGLGTAAGGLWRVFGRLPPAAMLIVLAIVLLVVPAILRISFTKPMAAKRREINRENLALLLKPAQAMRTDHFRRLVGRIAEKFDLLYKASEEDGDEHGTDAVSASALNKALGEIADLCATVVELEDQLQKIDESHRDGTGETSDYLEVLRVRRSIEGTLQQYIDRVLKFSVGLDRIATALAGVSGGKARIMETELQKLAESIVIRSQISRELA